MSNHFVSLNRGKLRAVKYTDFTTGTASTAGDDIELRVTDGPTAYNSGTTYNAGDTASYLNHVYRSLAGSNTANTPNGAGNIGLWWTDEGTMLSKTDVQVALEAFEAFFQDQNLNATFPPQ